MGMASVTGGFGQRMWLRWLGHAAPGRPGRAACPARSAAGPGAAERRRLINYGFIRQFAYPLHVKVRRASMATWVRLPGGLDVV